jgi:hypothetical protein
VVSPFSLASAHSRAAVVMAAQDVPLQATSTNVPTAVASAWSLTHVSPMPLYARGRCRTSCASEDSM